jgi:ABC-type uncharacterized transport system substrate-binding protein
MNSVFRNRLTALCVTAAVPAFSVDAISHPHVFAEARLEVVSDGKAVNAMRHVWRFDDLFSSTIILEFDKNSDAQLDDAERAAVARVIRESMAEYNFFQNVFDNGKDINVKVPADIMVNVEDNIVTLLFETVPEKPISLAGKVSFGVYDPTFYTSIEFLEDGNLAVDGEVPATCKPAVVRPDPDKALEENQQSLTDAFFSDPSGTDMSKIFATRLEITC